MDFDPEEILPELMLVGDLLAYINVFAMVFLLGMIGRVGVLLYVLKRTVEFAISCVSGILTSLWRLDFRHRRANSAGHRNEVLAKQSKAMATTCQSGRSPYRLHDCASSRPCRRGDRVMSPSGTFGIAVTSMCGRGVRD